MLIPVRSLGGMARIPRDRTSTSKWLAREGVPIHRQRGRGGEFEAVRLADLPEAERLAFHRRQLDALHLDPGTHDDAAHAAFLEAAPSLRAKAEVRAALAAHLVALIRQGAGWPERLRILRERFPGEAVSMPSLKRLLKAVKGVDPINYAPALLPGYKPATKRAELSPEAWRFFLTTIRDAGPEFPLIQAWRDTRDAGARLGWAVPSFATFWRRWDGLSEAQRLSARHGRDHAVKRLAQPAHRDKTTLGAMEIVSLDGRTLDFWADWGDGRAVRPVMLALVDVASNFVLGWVLAPSENAAATVRLVKQACERWGIFDQLYTDNGAAFAGHLVAGGAPHKFRNGGRTADGVQPLGICRHMGIRLRFALPANAQAKIAERTFGTLSRVIDDRPEFTGAHAGHAPGTSPSRDVVPVPIATVEAVVAREIDRHNRETGRRGQGAAGRSYEAMFRDGLAARVPRKATARQLYLSGLIYTPVAVDRYGRVMRDGWVYGGPATQEKLLRHHGTGRKVLLGRDPDDFSAPAIAFDDAGHLICEGIEPVQAGRYDSVDGIRIAARNRKEARDKVAAAEAANDYLADGDFQAALAALGPADPPAEAPVRRVVAGRFGAPLSDAPARMADSAETAIPEEFLRNMDTLVAASKARRGQSA